MIHLSKLTLSFFLLGLVLLSSCKEDEPMLDCTLSTDWVGSYEGTKTREAVTSGTFDANAVITSQSDGTIVIVYSFVNSDGSTDTITLDPINPTACVMNFELNGGEGTLDIDYDGTNLTIVEFTGMNLGAVRCTYELTKI